MRRKTMMAIMILAIGVMLTACTTSKGKDVGQESETNMVTEQTQETEETQTASESESEESTVQEAQPEENAESSSQIDMPILDEIDQNVQIGTTGAYMAAVQEAVNLLDWGIGTGLDSQEIKEATVDWLMNKGNDEQVAFAEKLKKVDDAYHELLGDNAQELLKSAACENTSYPWSDGSVETIEAVMDAVGLRPYEKSSMESEDWKITFEESLMANYQVTVDHYEDLGDGVYQVYVMIDGKSVPYVTVDSKTGDYHG